MINLKKFENLSKIEYATIRNLIIDENMIENSHIEQIIEQITKDRFNLGKAKFEFAQKLDINDPEACKVVIALCYYAMYHVCRAAIFHTHRSDFNGHEKVAQEIGNIIRKDLEESLDDWRDIRNEIDYSPYPNLQHSLKDLAIEAISFTVSCLNEIENYIKKRGVEL